MWRGVRNTIAGAAVVAAAALAGCGGLDGGPLVRPGEPTGQIQVANGSSYTLTAILISDCNASTYGFNRLPNGTTVPPGYSYTFTVSAGCWDVDAGLAYHEARQRLTVRPGGITRYTVTD
jgi:hypothetical protein